MLEKLWMHRVSPLWVEKGSRKFVALTNIVRAGTRPENLAGWVQQQDRVPLLLAISLYGSPIDILDDYTLEAYSNRYGIWVSSEGGPTVIGLKGTSLKSGSQDLSDDKVSSSITMRNWRSRFARRVQQSWHKSSNPYCNTSPNTLYTKKR